MTWTPGLADWELYSVTWSGSQFVVVSQDSNNVTGPIFTSTDGINWNQISPLDYGSLYGIAWSGKRFVAVGVNQDLLVGAILTSDNGSEWGLINNELNGYLYGITWSGSQFVAVGQDYSDTNTAAILTSTNPDGDDWQSQTFKDVEALYGITWSGNQFVAVGSAGTILTGTILTSGNGTNWSKITPPPHDSGSVCCRLVGVVVRRGRGGRNDSHQ